MRRFISMMMVVLMLANLAAWPSLALSEVLEHDREAVQLVDGPDQPAEPGPAHCQHGCAGHFGQHFQWQTGAISIVSLSAISDPVANSPEAILALHVPVLPFRPPLSAPILT